MYQIPERNIRTKPRLSAVVAAFTCGVEEDGAATSTAPATTYVTRKRLKQQSILLGGCHGYDAGVYWRYHSLLRQTAAGDRFSSQQHYHSTDRASKLCKNLIPHAKHEMHHCYSNL